MDSVSCIANVISVANTLLHVPTYLMTETLLFRVVKMDHSMFSVFSDVNYLFE